MAIKANATTVISDTPDIDFARLKDVPQVIQSVTNLTTGDTTNPFPTNAWLYSVVYTQATFNLTLTYDTNCACQCVCVCDCQCGG